MLNEIKAIKSGPKELRSFGITVGIVLGLLGGLLFWREKGSYPYLLILAGIFLLLGAGAPILLKPLHKAWMTLAVVLGWLMTRVVLTLLFYGVFTPFAAVARLFGKPFLEFKQDPSCRSYWIARERRPIRKSDYERPF